MNIYSTYCDTSHPAMEKTVAESNEDERCCASSTNCESASPILIPYLSVALFLALSKDVFVNDIKRR